MKFDIGDRRSGKTTRMIQWLLNAPEGERRVIVTHSESEAHRIRKLIKGMDIEVEQGQVISAGSQDLRGRNPNVVLGIDNLELVLGGLIGHRVSRVTATGELYQDD